MVPLSWPGGCDGWRSFCRAAHQPVHQADEWHLVGCGLAGAERLSTGTFSLPLDSGWGGSPAPPVDSFCFFGLFCLGLSCL